MAVGGRPRRVEEFDGWLVTVSSFFFGRTRNPPISPLLFGSNSSNLQDTLITRVSLKCAKGRKRF